jgi:hypothetical protein
LLNVKCSATRLFVRMLKGLETTAQIVKREAQKHRNRFEAGEVLATPAHTSHPSCSLTQQVAPTLGTPPSHEVKPSLKPVDNPAHIKSGRWLSSTWNPEPESVRRPVRYAVPRPSLCATTVPVPAIGAHRVRQARRPRIRWRLKLTSTFRDCSVNWRREPRL